MSLVAVQKIRENVFYDERTGSIYYDAIEDITDILRDNLVMQADPSNGFTKERTMRMIGNIPMPVYRQFAKRTGYAQMDRQQKRKEMDKFLREYREYCTGTGGLMKHNTAHQSHLIVK